MSKTLTKLTIIGALIAAATGCASDATLPEAQTRASLTKDVNNYQYLIGPGDSLTIFVWRNPENFCPGAIRQPLRACTALLGYQAYTNVLSCTVARKHQGISPCRPWALYH